MDNIMCFGNFDERRDFGVRRNEGVYLYVMWENVSSLGMYLGIFGGKI